MLGLQSESCHISLVQLEAIAPGVEGRSGSGPGPGIQSGWLGDRAGEDVGSGCGGSTHYLEGSPPLYGDSSPHKRSLAYGSHPWASDEWSPSKKLAVIWCPAQRGRESFAGLLQSPKEPAALIIAPKLKGLEGHPVGTAGGLLCPSF